MSTKERMARILARNVIYYRSQKGFTQESFAQKISISRTTLADMESGKGNPSAFLLYRIAQGLNIPMEKLILQEENSAPLQTRSLEPKKRYHSDNSTSYKYQTKENKLTVHLVTLKEKQSLTFPGKTHQTPQMFLCLQGQILVKSPGESAILKTFDGTEMLASSKKRLIPLGPEITKVLICTGQRDPFEVF